MAISPRLATSTLRNTAGSSLRRDSVISAERYRPALDRTRANTTRVGYQGDVRHHRHPAGMPPLPPAYATAFADGRRLRDEAYARRRRVAGRPYDHRHHARARVVVALVAVLVALTIASDGGVLLIGGGMLIGLATIAWILVLLASPMLWSRGS